MVVFANLYMGLGVVIVLSLYLTRQVAALMSTPLEILPLSPKRWTQREVLDAYEKAKTDPIDVKKFIPPRKDRRYVVVGASGLVGGWIVQHLLMRGEPPEAIRMLDVKPNGRSEINERGVVHIHTDIRDKDSVRKAFNAPWPAIVAKLPLTVFHTAAIIDSATSAKDQLPPLVDVNVNGTRNVLDASKAAGASAFVATSSSSVGLKAVKYFPPPWKYYPDNFIQIVPNADPEKPAAETEHSEYFGNYAVTKHLAEEMVRSHDNKETGFRTGCIRPGHAIYGHGVNDISSLTWRYLSRGGFPSWLHNYLQNFANAQDVSIAHLLFESELTKSTPKQDLGGRAYCVTDPGPPITFYDFYMSLSVLAKSPIYFPYIPPYPMLCLAYLVETYMSLQRRYATWLPEITGEIKGLTPAMFRASCVHLIFDTKAIREELGYRGAFTTLDGIAADLLVWNTMYEASQGKKNEIDKKIRNTKAIVP